MTKNAAGYITDKPHMLCSEDFSKTKKQLYLKAQN